MNLLTELRSQFATAIGSLTPNASEYAGLLRQTQDPKHGDYQANCAMPLKKELGGNPREIAEKIVAALPGRDRLSSVEVAGPGFINVRIDDSYLGSRLSELLLDDNMGLSAPEHPKTMVVDYSSPNVAKPMHVGHIRSTVIGDAIARIHRALGWKVIADNHLGDWGTQFGMLIYGWRNRARMHSLVAETGLLAEMEPAAQTELIDRVNRAAHSQVIGLSELTLLYPLVSKMSEMSEEVAEAARRETAKLHTGDPENLALWKTIMALSMEALRSVYERLDVKFDAWLGESFYDPMLGGVVADLKTKGIAEPSDGAMCVFFPDPKGKVDKEGKLIPLYPPFLVQKKDGAFTYATSDLACIKYRVEELKADVMLYVVDDRQSLHFEQLFATAKKWGFAEATLVHAGFGKILGEDGKPFTTRGGGTIALEDLLNEAVARSRKLLDELLATDPTAEPMSEDDRRAVSEVLGLGSIKFVDLSQNRQSDYIFDWNKMIQLKGYTAIYVIYAYARNRSIFRKGGVDPVSLAASKPKIELGHPSERTLGLTLLRYPEALDSAAADYRPNLLASYLYELANAYSAFFRDCHVLNAPTEDVRNSRLALCELTARTLRHGLGLLGIKTVERM